MGVRIFPTTNDVGGSGLGKVLSEANIADILTAFAPVNFVVSGMTVPSSDADLTMDIAAGVAIISGHRVYIDTATAVTVTANQTNHIYLQLTRDGSQNVTGVQSVANTTGTAPTDSVKIATCVAGASAITSTTDARVLDPFSPIISARIVSHGNNANGVFTKFDNGLMICRLAKELHAYSTGTQVTRNSAYSWTFPAAFSVAPAVSANCEVGFWLAPTGVGDAGGCNLAANNSIPGITTTGCRLAYNYITYGGLVWFHGLAIGAWK